MKRFFASAAMVLLILSLSIPAFSQGGFFATVTGTVTDSSKALVPGVTVKATASDTNVVTTSVTNEAGVYTFNNLLPGKYTISASLPGFQTKNISDAQLSQNTSYRYNFELSVSGVNTQVEVSISADTILATSGATVGQALSQQKVQALPIVGNNVLDLITVMAGVENVIPTNPPSAGNAFGRENTTFAGVSAQNVAIVRDGIQVQDNRNPNGIYSVTTINPDLVGEIRLILAPVDAEIGRGNGAIQYTTRSGTNRFTGSAVWSFRNTAFDPNTWTNNRNQSVPAGSPPGTVPVALRPDWNNVHQGTVSYGGPIIRNKTFFFGLFDFNQVNQRSLANIVVPTACARLGIFRYYNGWNNGNIFTPVNVSSASAAAFPSVRADGIPINPKDNGATTAGGLPPSWGAAGTSSAGVPYDPSLQAFSVFGALQGKPAKSDCSDAAVNTATLIPNGVNPGTPGAPLATNGSNGWDPYRKQLDQTAFITRTMDMFPLPNNYEVGDGLNTAGYRLLRHYNGLDNLFGSGESTGIRKQFNFKIDHNVNANNKANVNVTIERIHSDDTVAALPNMWSNLNFRRPIVISSGFTSTLSSTMLNEARFGMRRNGVNVIAPWDQADLQSDIAKYLPAPVNGFLVIPQMTTLTGFNCLPVTGSRPPGGCLGTLTATSIEKTPTFTYADTLSWTKGAHGLKFGGEFRANSSETKVNAPGGFFGNPVYARPLGGSITGTTQGTASVTDIASSNPSMTYLLTGAVGAQTSNAPLARALANYLAGSINNITATYFTTDPNNIGKWSDFRDANLVTTKLVQNEFSSFAKDDYKVTKNLTMNLGLRWDYYGVPYVDSGLTNGAVGGGASVFGISGRDFTGWMNPGARAALTTFEFVGPHSPNASKTVYPNDYNNFGPAVGFAYQLPFLGEGKTTIRGGYQVTFQGGGRFGNLQAPLAAPPGSVLDPSTPNWTNVYKDLRDVATTVPVVPSQLPMQPIDTTRRTSSYTAWDPNFVNPYTENLTLSVTRAVNRNVTLDVRYVGTMSKKQYTTLNLNIPAFLNNGLVDAVQRVRTGTETTKTAADPKSLLDQIFNGINICGVNCTTGVTYGAIGTTVGGVYQSAAYQMRSSTTFQGNLANGNVNGVAASIAGFNYVQTAAGNASLPPIAAGTVGGALRANGYPENYITTNPQFAAANLANNSGYNNYHSLEVQTSIRPIHGFSGQATYTWSKNLGLPGTLTDPTNRALDYTNVNSTPGQSLRTNGVVELPFGPNKLVMGNSSGWLARAVERWQLGLIYNLSSGAPVTITGANMLYGNGFVDVVDPSVNFKDIRGVRWGIQNGAFQEGRYFDNNDVFVHVPDPQCGTVTSQQSLNLNGTTARCTLQALARVVPAGTAGSFTLADGTSRQAVMVFQNAQPGTRGNLGPNTMIGLGSYRFDANLSKTFRISESKNVQVRFDSQNILNHPQPGAPSLAVNSGTPFGQITAKTQGRLFQGQLRFTF